MLMGDIPPSVDTEGDGGGREKAKGWKVGGPSCDSRHFMKRWSKGIEFLMDREKMDHSNCKTFLEKNIIYIDLVIFISTLGESEGTDNGKTPRTLPDLQITDTTRTQWFNKRVSVFRSSCVDMYNLGNYIPPPLPPPSPPSPPSPPPPPPPPPREDLTQVSTAAHGMSYPHFTARPNQI
ncbi:hypothetical protein HZH66_001331 [Vespula vulgaris]|uniref:Uncharacterized protein n=1 Tax=Vespula vulgaris TaxID=7454 RepID=A0A834KUB6_VESVU|nr:hypothetical protein HZH66_001331 [Vespula vulgaris]